MGTGKNKSKKKLHAKKKAYKRSVHKHWSIDGRKKDIDQIHDALEAKTAEIEQGRLTFDEDKPGMGQFYCAETDRCVHQQLFCDPSNLTIRLLCRRHRKHFGSFTLFAACCTHASG